MTFSSLALETPPRDGPRPKSDARDRDGIRHLSDPCLFLADDPGFESRLELLTDKQRHVLSLMACGRLNKQIAHECGITDATVKSHVSLILRRLGMRSRTGAAVRYALHMERRRAR